MSKVPTWFLLGVVAVGSAVGIVLLTAGKKIVVEIPLSDKSMRPKIGEGTRFVVDPSWLTARRKNAAVAFIPPGGREPRVARVVALPGDRIRVRDRRLYVNGKPARGTKHAMPQDSAPEFVCPAGCVYVLVDNSSGKSKDSADFGPLPMWRVLGSL